MYNKQYTRQLDTLLRIQNLQKEREIGRKVKEGGRYIASEIINILPDRREGKRYHSGITRKEILLWYHQIEGNQLPLWYPWEGGTR